MFTPPFCPHEDCPKHLAPSRHFYHKHGYFHSACRAHPVPRFRCLACERTFSRQTFRSDYRDRRPYLNAPLINLVTMGVGIRMCSRRLGLTLRCTELKLRKIAAHLEGLNKTLRRPLSGEVQFVFDELETFETDRGMCPVTVPVLIERSTRFFVATTTAPIRPKGRMTPRRLERLASWNEKHGRRLDQSKSACRRALQIGAALLDDTAELTLFSDEKTTYPVLAREAFGKSLVAHHKTNSQRARTPANPLFPINHEDARIRDIMGRLRRQSWLASKSRKYLGPALQVHAAYRNFVRERFNGEKVSAAQLLGFTHRRMTLGELLSWSLRWGKRSRHPLSRRGLSVAAYDAAMVSPA